MNKGSLSAGEFEDLNRIYLRLAKREAGLHHYQEAIALCQKISPRSNQSQRAKTFCVVFIKGSANNYLPSTKAPIARNLFCRSDRTSSGVICSSSLMCFIIAAFVFLAAKSKL